MSEIERTTQTNLLAFTINIKGRNLTLTELKDVLRELGFKGE